MPKTLFFFTSSYPFGKGETFIENEISYLAEAFHKVVIVSNDTINIQTREVPKNVVLERKGYELSTAGKLLSTLQIFNILFFKELNIIKKHYNIKITLPVVNTMLQTLHKAKVWSKFLEIMVNKYSKNENIYLYSYWNNDMAFAIADYKRKHKNITAFSRMHGWDTYFEASEINYLPFRSYIFNNLNRVFAISQKGNDYYSELLPKYVNKISVSYLGVPKRGDNKVNTSTEFQILTISNTIALKNLETLVRALALLNIPFKWVHFGDGNLQNEIAALAQQLIPGKFDMKGRVSNSQVIEYLNSNQVDVFVNVSFTEGIPVSIMEVMSFGIPVIATNVGGTSEIVNNKNGFLINPKPTPAEVANTINTFYNLTDNEKAMKRKVAFNTWNAKFNAPENYTNFAQLILHL